MVGPMMADPPIDDDSYQYEEQTFPSSAQKHVLYAEYVLLVSVSRIFEWVFLFAIALAAPASLVPITLYALAKLILVPWLEKYSRGLLFSVYRIRLITVGMLAQTATCLLACVSLWLVLPQLEGAGPRLASLPIKSWILLVVALLAAVTERSIDFMLVLSLETDWTRIMSNEQTLTFNRISQRMHKAHLSAQLLAPPLAGLLMYCYDISTVLKMMVLLSLMAMLPEFGLIHNLYSSCFALYLPRSLVRPEEYGGASFSSTFKRVLVYIRRRPKPVTATVGMILTKASVLVIGPQVLTYLLSRGTSIILLGLLPPLQLLAYIVPIPYASISFIIFVLATAGSAWLVIEDFSILLAPCIIVARTALQSADEHLHKSINGSIQDKEVLRIYRLIENGISHTFEIAAQFLTIAWPSPDFFYYPAVTSASLSLVGVLLLLVSKMLPADLA